MKLRINDQGTDLQISFPPAERRMIGIRRRRQILKLVALMVKGQLDVRRQSGGSDQGWAALRMPEQARGDTPLSTIKYKSVASGPNKISVGSSSKVAGIHDAGAANIRPTKHHALYIPLTQKARSGYRRGATTVNPAMQKVPVMRPYRDPLTGRHSMRPLSPLKHYGIREFTKGSNRGGFALLSLVPGRIVPGTEGGPLRFEAARKKDRERGRKPDYTFFRMVTLPQRRQFVVTSENLRDIGHEIKRNIK